MYDLLEHIILGDDDILVKPTSEPTSMGDQLVLPPKVSTSNVLEGEVVRIGYGRPIWVRDEFEVMMKDKEYEERTIAIPVNAKIGDIVYFSVTNAIEMTYNGNKYFLLSDRNTLMKFRKDI